jgi:RNA polymerase sigma-70 factor, ECF subfamily
VVNLFGFLRAYCPDPSSNETKAHAIGIRHPTVRVLKTDDSLIAAAQAGSPEAFEELVLRTSRLVYVRLYLDLGDPHEAEDLTQETFLLAYRSLDKLKDRGQFRSWLCAIADNARIDAGRAERRQKRAAPPRSPAEALGAVAGKTMPPDAEAERRERREQVLTTVRSLPEDYRLPVMLRYFAGADYGTIETQLGMSNGALRGMLHRGLKLLREKLEAQGIFGA